MCVVCEKTYFTSSDLVSPTAGSHHGQQACPCANVKDVDLLTPLLNELHSLLDAMEVLLVLCSVKRKIHRGLSNRPTEWAVQIALFKWLKSLNNCQTNSYYFLKCVQGKNILKKTPLSSKFYCFFFFLHHFFFAAVVVAVVDTGASNGDKTSMHWTHLKYQLPGTYYCKGNHGSITNRSYPFIVMEHVCIPRPVKASKGMISSWSAFSLHISAEILFPVDKKKKENSNKTRKNYFQGEMKSRMNAYMSKMGDLQLYKG